MTLLISTKSQNGVIVTADGRASIESNSGYLVASDSLQKIFPYSFGALAVASHGENEVCGEPVSVYIERILGSIGSEDVDMVACRCLCELDNDITHTLSENAFKKYCGFWFIGATVHNGFAVYEIDWFKTDHGIQRKITPHGHLVIGGDCADPIKIYLRQPINVAYSHEKLSTNNYRYAVEFSDILYDMVMDTSPTMCGGHKHQLLVSESGTSWITKPAKQLLDKEEKREGKIKKLWNLLANLTLRNK